MNHNNAFSIASRTIAAVGHPLIKRANLGFALNQPFAWTLINAASTFAQLDHTDEHFEERADQLKIKMASMRHFNRMVGDNDIGMGTINACLRPDEKDVSLEEIKELAKDRIRIERRSGKLKPSDVKVRYVQLYTTMYEEACAKKRRVKALMNEVFFLCNRSDEVLSDGQCKQDAELVDFDQYDYVVESLLDKCTQPVIRATEELQRVMDRSYRLETVTAGDTLMAELKKLGTELGINWAKITAETAKIDAELAQAAAEDNAVDANLDDVFAEADAEFTAAIAPETPAPRVTHTIKSPERQAREAEEARVRAEQLEHQAQQAKSKAKAAATRAANKAKKQAEVTA